MRRATLLMIAAVCAVALTATACATGRYYPYRTSVGDRDDRAYFDRGFREGRIRGVEDARRGRGYDAARHGEYRDNRRGDDRGDLRAYRRGFEAGYDEGYRTVARGPYTDSRRGIPPSSYPSTQGPYDRGRGPRLSAAHEDGYRDGVEAGRRAARNGDRFDPVRERRYREGDHDYDRQYGSRDEYKREYRDAFRQGYADGYRDRR